MARNLFPKKVTQEPHEDIRLQASNLQSDCITYDKRYAKLYG